jgi:hypothetical protein
MPGRTESGREEIRVRRQIAQPNVMVWSRIINLLNQTLRIFGIVAAMSPLRSTLKAQAPITR